MISVKRLIFKKRQTQGQIPIFFYSISVTDPKHHIQVQTLTRRWRITSQLSYFACSHWLFIVALCTRTVDFCCEIFHSPFQEMVVFRQIIARAGFSLPLWTLYFIPKTHSLTTRRLTTHGQTEDTQKITKYTHWITICLEFSVFGGNSLWSSLQFHHAHLFRFFIFELWDGYFRVVIFLPLLFPYRTPRV